MYRIRVFGDPVLRKRAKPVTKFDDNLEKTIERMIETMYHYDGVGLAAPQVGISQRFFVMDVGNGPVAVINPEILEIDPETEVAEEGCLSFPEIFVEIERSKRIKVRYQNTKGEYVEEVLEGYAARVFQHEFDHLNGVLIIDRISPAKRLLLRKKLMDIARTVKR
ncbi:MULTISPECIES: peptide deformylase [Thermotoga]|jgi:peptide deformylase|uniref:Peptide deformylase n=1 Tax=Thermotoga petrophila (strain ATCC BAA-488 / DSM 13995 / JCM 10881 / RKU-1) TaxID=390874 RepID=DEF_THEP1|nr:MULTISPECIES: peptide deformylase [Thermotoga]A5ILS1.1 RecName: Full=Peptide deformylase; Short=PDF; AltName: Full=Polypeptide deformylase [Thermotoga petrophila RKU-1]HAA82789.1 peptide deformylase [Thermotoga petrophila]ABQ47144.1 peptide deformylase [Thermotoga petrophila RKU-1]KAF2960837.1 peptide deformylase [Thermotoga sp. 38H-to]KHC92420.1 peptide deformylase [Thermotoga sp. Mc24]